MIAGTLMCSSPPAEEYRLVVRVPLPSGGLTIGSDQAPLVIVEFGSLGCPYCLAFHDSVLPGLDSLFVRRGLAQFRYVSVDTTVPLLDLSAWMHCDRDGLGVSGVLDEAWRVMRDRDSLTLQAIAEPSSKETACRQQGIESTMNEARVASALGVRKLPTFVVGVPLASGGMVGWVVEGLHEPYLLETVNNALEQLENQQRRK